MADIVGPEVRSRMMSAIRGKNTEPEMVVRSFLHRSGLRFRLHDRSLPGRPDIVLARHGAIVQIHGCFWHQHQGCRYAYRPTSNVEKWAKKFAENLERDARTEGELRDRGWRVYVVWECEVGDAARLSRLVNAIRNEK